MNYTNEWISKKKEEKKKINHEIHSHIKEYCLQKWIKEKLWFLSHQELLLPQGQNIPVIYCTLENQPAKAFSVFIQRTTLIFILPVFYLSCCFPLRIYFVFTWLNFASVKSNIPFPQKIITQAGKLLSFRKFVSQIVLHPFHKIILSPSTRCHK